MQDDARVICYRFFSKRIYCFLSYQLALNIWNNWNNRNNIWNNWKDTKMQDNSKNNYLSRSNIQFTIIKRAFMNDSSNDSITSPTNSYDIKNWTTAVCFICTFGIIVRQNETSLPEEVRSPLPNQGVRKLYGSFFRIYAVFDKIICEYFNIISSPQIILDRIYGILLFSEFYY